MDYTLSNRCRACAVPISSEQMISLFENSLCDMFTHCTSIEISSSDSLPSRICPECFNKLSDLNKFRQSCAESDAYFREQIFLESIKVEPRTDVDIKFERNAVNQDLESDFFQIEYIDKCDTYLSAPNTLAPTVETDSAKFICDYCGKHFNQRNHIAAHMSTHFPVRLKKTFPCTVKGCRKVLTTNHSLKKHRLNIHKLESETMKLNCPQCHKRFDIQLRLDAHIRSFHHGLKGFKCELCDMEYCTYRSLQRHLRSHHGSDEREIHNCPLDGCDKSYKLEDSLRTHMRNIHLGMVPELTPSKLVNRSNYPDLNPLNTVTSEEETNSMAIKTANYICDYCGKQFNRRNHIAAHMAIHFTAKLNKTFPCTVKGCRKVLKARKSLKYHILKIHNLELEPATKTVKLKCPECPKRFDMQMKLDAHIRSFHHGLSPYKCDPCEKEFCSYRSLRRHLQSRRHASDKTVITTERERHYCPLDGCDKSYTVKDSLHKHMEQVHLGRQYADSRSESFKRNRKCICEQCGQTFSNAYRLEEHTSSHSGITPFACEVCPKTFATIFKLKVHAKRHLKPHECPTCGRRFSTKKGLAAHVNFHTKEITYPCKECPRVFPSYGAINRHVRIHHRNHKPYICTHCQRAFTKLETLRNHIMTHTGEKPFSCSVCGHRFIQSVALKTHMKVHAKK